MNPVLNKLPAITLAFWVMKICATTLGETAGDLVSMTLNIGYGVSSLLLMAVFVVTLAAQLRASRFHPFLYWLVILSTSTAGTTMSDYMDRTLALGYAQGAAILVTLLIAILTLWRGVCGSLSVQHITTRREEYFYWAAILISNTLGTAFGDFLADDSDLGFMGGAVVVGAAILCIVALYRFTRLSRVALFWCAFVLTRPFGATMGDLLTKTHEKGGLDFGTVGASAVLAVILVVLIIRSNHAFKKGATQ
ncbi:MAG: hypothetical protein ACKVOE_09790 [Rickettsiales bacterium]